jgi:hypothetical protein
MNTNLASRGFQQRRYVDSPSGCFFYHSIDLPGFGLQVGHWDLRADIDAYLGPHPLAGRRVVDVGAASGYVSLEMEKRGAEVIAFDRELDDVTDDMGLIPFDDFESRFGMSLATAIEHRRTAQRRLQDSFWLAHRLFESKNRLYCGNVYRGMPDAGPVDVSFFGCILLHLRDPLLALTQFGRITRQTLIITDTFENIGPLTEYAVAFLRPNINDASNSGTWWWPTPKLLQSFLEILGFRRFELSRHTARHVVSSADVPMYTLVAHR